MKIYLFEITANREQRAEEITEQYFYYKVYNEFLEKFHMTNIEENEDFIPYIIRNNKTLMILRTDENIEALSYWVFDLLQNCLCKVA